MSRDDLKAHDTPQDLPHLEDLPSSELLRQLAELDAEDAARVGESYGDAWDHLAAGTLSADEEGQLHELAHKSESAANAYDAFRPLGQDFKAKALASARQGLGQSELPTSTAPPPRPRERRSRRWPRLLAAALAATLAALAVTWLLRPVPVPDYGIEIAWHVDTRGINSDPSLEPPPPSPGINKLQTLILGSILQIELTPSKNGLDDLAARVVLVRGESPDLRLEEWETVEAGSFGEGQIVLRGTFDQAGQPGSGILAVAFGHPAHLPSLATLGTALITGATEAKGWKLKTWDVDLEPPISEMSP